MEAFRFLQRIKVKCIKFICKEFFHHISHTLMIHTYLHTCVREILRGNIYSIKIKGSMSDIKFYLQVVQLFPFFEIIVKI